VTKISAIDLAKRAQSLGAKTIIYTDISKDGALKGPNLTEVAAMADAVKIDVIASGGIGTLADLEALKKLKRKNISGVIIGKALYENKFTLPEAIKTCLPNG
jgi:phosphoribosylformimino-5-aminoimidazole carboxamide ribotide isomerase